MTKIVQWGSEDARHVYGGLSGHFQPRIDEHDIALVFIELLFR